MTEDIIFEKYAKGSISAWFEGDEGTTVNMEGYGVALIWLMAHIVRDFSYKWEIPEEIVLINIADACNKMKDAIPDTVEGEPS